LRYDRRKSPGGIAPGHRSRWTGCTNLIPSTCSTRAPNRIRAGTARSS
jgi:hypothetical protein